MPPRRKSTDQHELVERPSRKRPLPADDPYEVPDEDDAIPSAKRQRRQSQDGGTLSKRNATPRKQVDFLHSDLASVPEEPESPTEQTPSKKRLGRPPKALTGGTPKSKPSTPSALRKNLVDDTPVKLRGLNGVDTPSRRGIADRSARRKSARALIDRVLEGAVSDDEDEEQQIAREIYESSEQEEEDEENTQRQESLADEEADLAATTPSKTGRGRGRGGRPPGSATRRKKSPTPPRDLPPHEQYFYQNKPGSNKTSNNTLSSLDLLTHEEYFSLLREPGLQREPHEEQIQALQSHHAASFPQWAFELSQGFSVCLYGYGSKRRLLHQFAEYLSSSEGQNNNKIILINGHHRTLTIREILTTISLAVDPTFRLPSGNPLAMIQNLFSLLSSSAPKPAARITLLFTSLDSPLSPTLRKPATQSLLAHLSSHPSISLACTVDTPDFPLLWDSSLRSSFNFAFHDCTTFAPFSGGGPPLGGPVESGATASNEMDVVSEVHELLGRMGKRAGGKEGVAFVLRSLPENARKLFGLIVGEVLVAFEEGGGSGEFVGGRGESPGVEYRMLYNKAVEEFICSSEMAFRTLLKEFHDHQIITSHKDSIGTEYLSLPFRKVELESILEELMS
ncbi:origin recognition complex subunit 2-domain-containing protein [Pseudoneurospora amorphoporcata]|uniref:Origin recognition complex subunit 2 n=1 Tax=Pseudoneurospora amorphoporcata TaxID=241081 RepID=A0AAN6P0H2_9PEZI|nr:origin recognition complex subunit 2-domain-containing protein [Pseudoneurospora amorphoporcata]